jgi:hypothetical protein
VHWRESIAVFPQRFSSTIECPLVSFESEESTVWGNHVEQGSRMSTTTESRVYDCVIWCKVQSVEDGWEKNRNVIRHSVGI